MTYEEQLVSLIRALKSVDTKFLSVQRTDGEIEIKISGVSWLVLKTRLNMSICCIGMGDAFNSFISIGDGMVIAGFEEPESIFLKSLHFNNIDVTKIVFEVKT